MLLNPHPTPPQERVPFQYLISSAHWHTYVLSVGPGVLIPRPETEIFPDIVRQAVSERPQLAAAPWADLGTGSGAIAISTADVLRKHNKVSWWIKPCSGMLLLGSGRYALRCRRPLLAIVTLLVSLPW